MQADEALPELKDALKDRDLAKQALVAMCNLGKDGLPLLIDRMNSSPQVAIRAAAAKGLGQIGGIAGDASVVPPLLTKLQDPKTDWAVLAEGARVHGKIPDKRAIQPLYDLDRKLQAIREPRQRDAEEAQGSGFWGYYALRYMGSV